MTCVKTEHANREYFEKLERLLALVEKIDGVNTFITKDPLSEDPLKVSLSELDALLDLHRKPEPHSLYNMFNRIFVTFLGKDFSYLLSVPSVVAFLFTVIDKTVTLKFETVSDGMFEESFDLVGVSDRMYLCRLLSGISPTINLMDWIDLDFIYELKNRELVLKPIVEEGANDVDTTGTGS